MTRLLRVVRAHVARWWIHHNPMYLMSAACMAVGVKLYLDAPETRAGDAGMILMTLGLLQFYEWCIATILIALYRGRRAPDDQPSLLLLAGLFWTGPLVATLEMTAHRPFTGLMLALLACGAAWAELAVVRSQLSLRIHAAVARTASLCVLLLAITPWMLARLERPDGTNELLLYAVWWVLAALFLSLLPSLCRFRHRAQTMSEKRQSVSEHVPQALFLCMTFAACVVHLLAVNYSLFTHARFFYGAPLAVVACVLLIELFSCHDAIPGWAKALPAAVPAFMIPPAFEFFDPAVPVAWLPLPLRDPVATTFCLAAVAWWFTAARLRRSFFLHLGTASAAMAMWRLVRTLSGDVTTLAHAAADGALQGRLALFLYGTAIYFLLVAWLRRSRVEWHIALACHVAAFAFLCFDRTPQWPMHLFWVTGWTGILAAMPVTTTSRRHATAGMVALLLLGTLAADFSPVYATQARLHALVLPIVMILGGAFLHRPARLGLGVAAGMVETVFYAGRWVATGTHAAATLWVAGGFLLLAIGAWVSWNKRRWLDAMPNGDPTVDPSHGSG